MRTFILFFLALAVHAQDFVPFLWDNTSGGNNLLTGLEAFWRFEETTGNALDSSGNGRTLTENGTLASGTGVVGTDRLYADADETDYFERASEAVFGFSGDFTITAWVDADFTAPAVDDKTILARGDYGGSNFSWLLLFDNGATEHFSFYWSTDGTFNPSNIVDFDTGTSISGTSGFYFVVIRRTGTTLKISGTHITDLVLATEATGTVSGTLFHDGTNTLRAGDLEGSDIHDMRGAIDEVGIWSRYLSDCEIAWLWRAKAGTFTYTSFNGLPCVAP